MIGNEESESNPEMIKTAVEKSPVLKALLNGHSIQSAVWEMSEQMDAAFASAEGKFNPPITLAYSEGLYDLLKGMRLINTDKEITSHAVLEALILIGFQVAEPTILRGSRGAVEDKLREIGLVLNTSGDDGKFKSELVSHCIDKLLFYGVRLHNTPNPEEGQLVPYIVGEDDVADRKQ